ncbi:unnamed protein product [Arabis nemorensis]|uniref:SWIM-type domain-containing protein n=1 Tax=Arabis nemorensis TaxID=586526 RepID=A0A565AS37_9BRAS|nr:unnamed protein product [Arabis nemorensis]
MKPDNTIGGIDDVMLFWQGVEGERYIMASQSVLEEIFTAEEIVVFERSHMERAKKVAAAGQGFETERTVAPMSLNTEGDSVAWTSSFTAAVGHLNLVTPSKEVSQEQVIGFETPNSNPQCSQQKTIDKGKGKVVDSDLGDMPSLQLTMGRSSVSAPNEHQEDTEPSDDDSSDSSLFGGDGFKHENEVYVGMIFRIECNGRSCPWRVYAVKMGGSEWYQVRRVRLDHSCTIDERGDFQRLATSSVIEDMMRSTYNGMGAGLRPARGSTGASDNSLQTYLEKIVLGNQGTIVGLETIYDEAKTCSCCEFQKLAIPCSHGVAAALRAKVKVDSLLADEYTNRYLKMAYSQSIYPTADVPTGLRTTIADLKLLPPSIRRPPGRPRKTRITSRGEIRITTTLSW